MDTVRQWRIHGVLVHPLVVRPLVLLLLLLPTNHQLLHQPTVLLRLIRTRLNKLLVNNRRLKLDTALHLQGVPTPLEHPTLLLPIHLPLLLSNNRPMDNLQHNHRLQVEPWFPLAKILPPQPLKRLLLDLLLQLVCHQVLHRLLRHLLLAIRLEHHKPPPTLLLNHLLEMPLLLHLQQRLLPILLQLQLNHQPQSQLPPLRNQHRPILLSCP
jgi:hypothetical protein